MKGNSLINNFITNTVKIIFWEIIFFLLIIAISKTCCVDLYETTYYKDDNVVKNFTIIALSLIICYLIGLLLKKTTDKQKEKITKLIKYISFVGIILFIIFSFIWIMATQLIPRADQHYVLKAAQNIAEKKYSDFEKGGYLDIYPEQSGIVLLMYYWGKLFGSYNYLSLQLINIFAVVIAYYYIYKICNKMFNKNSKSELYFILIALCLYIQFAFYTTFVYGNLIGLMFSIIGIYYELKFLENNNMVNILICTICIVLAIIIKANYLITLIAMCILLIYDALKNKKTRNMIIVFFMIALYIIGSKIVIISMENITGHKLSKGVPKTAWIEMGLQDGGYASGWYNGYNKIVYLNNNCDTEKTKIAIKKDFEKTIKGYKQNPSQFINYMAEKIISQWNNPTFQCIWINQNRITYANVPKWAEDIIAEKGYYNNIVKYTNAMQTLVLFGVFMYITLEFKNIEFKELFLAIIFIGGFLFHIIWEAKCQYTITYFILLIPYSIKGYSKIVEIMQDKELKKEKV